MQQSAVFILSFFSLYSFRLLNDLSLEAFHSPSGSNSFTKLAGLLGLYLYRKKNPIRSSKEKRVPGGIIVISM